ncbi:MAG: carboxypeptidase regulatory-like domain-containing protein, partial [Acidobacteriota bacterium]
MSYANESSASIAADRYPHRLSVVKHLGQASPSIAVAVRVARWLFVLAALVLVPGASLGQSLSMASIGGRVELDDGTPLAGVEIRATGPTLLGRRASTTSASGDYVLGLLPSGEFTLLFSGSNLEPVSRILSLEAGTTTRLDLTMHPAVLDSLDVVAESDTVSEISDNTIAANFSRQLVNTLPIDRTLRSVVLLAPGVTDNGPIANTGSANERAALMISGAPSYDSLYLINGVVVNENLRGQPQDLFIEDAIEDIRVETGRISAEYGRFTGGVVNVVTRSGGNRFTGSFRTTLTDGGWSANNKLDRESGIDNRSDSTDATYEATIGGPMLEDRLWFFGAARSAQLQYARSTSQITLPGDIKPIPVPYTHGLDERRLEAKLSGAPAPSHTLIASYLDYQLNETNSTFNPNILDIEMLVPVTYPSSMLALRYAGVVTNRLLVEGQYSERHSAIEQGGDELADRIAGTWLLDPLRGGARFHSPVSRPGAQRYDGESWSAKASYFLPTESLGSHDLRMGIERVEDYTRSNLPFSGSDFDVRTAGTIRRGSEVFPILAPGSTIIEYSPILTPNRGARLATDSVYFHDRALLGRRWTLDLGLRYDRNDDRAGDGFLISNTGSFSPRLGLSIDPHGGGRFVINAGYGVYVAKNQDAIAVFDLAGGGSASRFAWLYGGPCINCEVEASSVDLVPTDQALGALFAWFDAEGGVDRSPQRAEIPGFSTTLPAGSLEAPSVREYTLGVVANLGVGGYVRADLMLRDWENLYNGRIDTTTGKTEPDPYHGRVYDRLLVENSNRLDRTYQALQAQFFYRFSPAFYAQGSYTWSRLEGNFSPEQRCCAAGLAEIDRYPEYNEKSWNHPQGYLSSFGRPGWTAADQRHRLRLWLGGRVSMGRNELSAVLLQSLDSGLPYESAGQIDPTPWVANPGYVTPPRRVTYFFSEPAAFRTDTITSTNLALIWSLQIYRSSRFFIKPEVMN